MTKLTKKQQLMLKWIVTLESGNYKQGKYKLRTRDNRCCCLGVLCDIVDPSAWGRCSEGYEHDCNLNMPRFEISDTVGLNESDAARLARMNDIGSSFKEIATYLRKTQLPVEYHK